MTKDSNVASVTALMEAPTNARASETTETGMTMTVIGIMITTIEMITMTATVIEP